MDLIEGLAQSLGLSSQDACAPTLLQDVGLLGAAHIVVCSEHVETAATALTGLGSVSWWVHIFWRLLRSHLPHASMHAAERLFVAVVGELGTLAEGEQCTPSALTPMSVCTLSYTSRIRRMESDRASS